MTNKERKKLIRLVDLFENIHTILAKNHYNGTTTAKRIIRQIIDYLTAVLNDEAEKFDSVIIRIAQKYKSLFIVKAGLSEFYIHHDDYKTRRKSNLEYEKLKKEIEKILGVKT